MPAALLWELFCAKWIFKAPMAQPWQNTVYFLFSLDVVVKLVIFKVKMRLCQSQFTSLLLIAL